jgi:hypothetical protein
MSCRAGVENLTTAFAIVQRGKCYIALPVNTEAMQRTKIDTTHVTTERAEILRRRR